MTKRKKIIILSLFLLFLATLIIPRLTLAQETQSDRCKGVTSEIPLQQPIPIITEDCCLAENKNKDLACVKDIGEYLVIFYKYFSGIVGILSAAMIVYAGIQWIVAAGNSTAIERAKTTMNGALIGLVLTLSAYLILYTINPELISMRIPHLGTFAPVYVGSNYCADMPKISGMPEIPEQIPCGGDPYQLPKPTEGEAGYTQDYCCGNYCSPVGGRAQVCAIAKGQTIGEGERCPEQCLDAEEACRKTHKNECDKTDALFAQQGINKVCRKAYKGLALDRCVISQQLPENPCQDAVFAPTPTWTRISCRYFGLENDVDTPCWKINKPATTSAGCGYEMKCTDDTRAGTETDSFCCARKDKGEIDCRDKGHGDEVQVPCDQPIFGNTLSYNDMPEQYDDNGPIVCLTKCWLQLGLQELGSDYMCGESKNLIR